MFKAIGRWGSSVKSNLNLKFITNLFGGSKSKSYNEIESDEEEIFCDAPEEPIDEDLGVEIEVVDGRIVVAPDTGPAGSTTNNTTTVNGSPPANTLSEVVTIEHSSHTYSSSDDDGDGDDEGDGDDIHSPQDNVEHRTSDNEEGHGHKDSDKILETDSTKPSNGIIRNASSSAFKKVHRRISSFSQRQYAKMDDNVDGNETDISKDPNDNITEGNGVANGKSKRAKQKSTKSKEEKKNNKNKVAKRTRKAIRGSWKWVKRGMLGYARAFNAPSFFVINVSGMAATRKY